MKGKAEPMNVYFLSRKTPEISIESPTTISESGDVSASGVGVEVSDTDISMLTRADANNHNT